jgi:2-keto-4-pentenoate hydratase/2-oxohepta-3-ene-1,7-dioic acid hydratase in catechol pathway
MKLCRFDIPEGGADRLGLVDGDSVIDVSGALDVLPPLRWPVPPGDALVDHLDAVRAKAETLRGEGARFARTAVRLKSPVANPSKVFAAPLNYAKHVDESKSDANLHQNTHKVDFEPGETPVSKLGLFLKSSSSVVGPADGVTRADGDRRTDHEIELAVVIGQQTRHIASAEALDVVAGYCIGLDMTLRGTEERSYRKSPDGYTVLGPWLVTADEIADPSALDFWLEVKGERRQTSNTRELTVGIRDLIAIASSYMTLYPGDVILTGTPDGVGPVVAGDTMTCWIDQIGEMDVPVR